MDCDKVVDVFNQYTKANKIVISRAEFEKNLIPKMKVHEFIGDVSALLSDGIECIIIGWHRVHYYRMASIGIPLFYGLSWIVWFQNYLGNHGKG